MFNVIYGFLGQRQNRRWGLDADSFFREGTLGICGTLDIEEALGRTFSFLRQVMPLDTLGLGFSELESRAIRVLAKANAPGARFVWRDGTDEIPLSDAMVEYVATSRAPWMVINQPGAHPPPLLDAFPGIAHSSIIFVRLDLPGGEEVGSILASAEGPNRFRDEHAELLTMLREPFGIAMSNARRYRELLRLKERLDDENKALSADVKRVRGVDVVGADFGLRSVMEQVRQVAGSNSATLLLGETGTGKEIVANALHLASPRAEGPFISLQCGAVPDTLLDSELFGHEKGAFTGALAKKRGRFERADGGTLFLDEVGELSAEAQVKLLRVLQERRFERVGGTQSIEADVRVVAATHRDLQKMVREGTFREDLWYRLSVLPIRIPPLRLRLEDIPSLVAYFVERKAQELGLVRVPRVSAHEVERLKRYAWPGNVRELQNVVERALLLSDGHALHFPLLSDEPAAPTRSRRERVLTMDEAAAEHLRDVLERVDWQVAGRGGAAELLDVHPSTLRFRMRKLGVVRQRRANRP